MRSQKARLKLPCLVMQVVKVQKTALATITAKAREQMQQGQRELSRNVLAPTIQVRAILLACWVCVRAFV